MIKNIFQKYGITNTKFISRGAEGTVYQGYFNNKKVAIKQTKSLLNAKNEFKFTNSLNTISRPIENLIHHQDKILLIMPFLSGPDLFDYARNQYELLEPEKYILSMEKPLIDINQKIKILQHKKINHLDIKPENIIWCDYTKEWKLIDFSRAIYTKDNYTKINNIVGTKSYLPPEIKNSKVVHLNSDIWSFGVTSYCILTQQPFIRTTFKKCLFFKTLPINLQESVINCVKWDPETRSLPE